MRLVFMAYLKDSINAVDFYRKAFNAESRCYKHKDDDNFYAHAEIFINDQTVLALSDILHYDTAFTSGSNMQFWITFNDEKALSEVYEVLKENAKIHYALGPCEWCKAMADFTDKYGVLWHLSL